MFQNKIYQNFIIEIFKTFFTILLGLSLIALTVRAVNFLELIVDSGYPVSIYFKYSFLNIFGLMPKFIPLSFLLTITIFIIKHLQDSEFVILWTSGVKKMQVVNLLFFISIIVVLFYLLLSIILTPYALNQSRQLLSKEQLNSFLPTVRTQQFSDSFRGFTFLVEKKFNNQLKNIFLHDKSNNLKNLSSNIADNLSTTIIANNGIIDKKKLILFKGQIITSKKDKLKNEIIKFDQLNINLSKLNTSTIKSAKIQETSTFELLGCFTNRNSINQFCIQTEKEIIPNLSRRIVLPFYIPVIALVSSLLLIKTKRKTLSKICIFTGGFVLLLFTELIVRYTGINNFAKVIFFVTPIILFSVFYFYLLMKFSRESKVYE